MLVARGGDILRPLVWSLVLYTHNGLIFLSRRLYYHRRRNGPSNECGVEGGKQSTLLTYHLSSAIDVEYLDCVTDLRDTYNLFSSGRLRFIYSRVSIGSCWAGATSYTQDFVHSVLILLVVYHNGGSRSMQGSFFGYLLRSSSNEGDIAL